MLHPVCKACGTPWKDGPEGWEPACGCAGAIAAPMRALMVERASLVEVIRLTFVMLKPPLYDSELEKLREMLARVVRRYEKLDMEPYDVLREVE